MVWHPTKEAVRRLWGRRWVRRVSYALVAGATTVSIVPWVASQPPVVRWATGRIGALVKEETGLPLVIGHLEIHPLLGRLVLQEVDLGEGLLRIHRVEVHADLWSLLGSSPHLYSVRVERPMARITEAGLSAIRFKARPPRKGPLPQVRLDLFSLTDGQVEVPTALRGFPPVRYEFEAKATGLGANHLRVDLAGPRLAVEGPDGWEQGRLDLNGEVTEDFLDLREAYLRLGASQFRASGRLELVASRQLQRVDAKATGVLGLVQAARWGGLRRAPLAGSVDLKAGLRGTLAAPRWSLEAGGPGLLPAGGLRPGRLELKTSGNLQSLRLEHLEWQSADGELHAEGAWSRHAPIKGRLEGQDLDLGALGRVLRLPELQGVRAQLKADLEGPGDPSALARPDRWQGQLEVSLTQHGLEAGSLRARLEDGQANLDLLRLELEALQAEGRGSAKLDARGLQHLEAVGRVEIGAGQVAQALRAWKIVDLDMEGQTRAQATVQWRRRTGLELDGFGEVSHPRWHGARADAFQAKVQIRDSDLRVTEIDLTKGEGRGSGDLWLTWGRGAPGQPQMDMCFTAFRLPVAEGLRAAGLKTSDGEDLPIQGLATGWGRLQGRFERILLNGTAQIESGEAYGINIPAASSDFAMDLATLHLRLDEVRLAERPDLLGGPEGRPDGSLALQGKADMDFRKWTWWVDLAGRVDTQLLALPGPRIQARMDARLMGPITYPFGPLDLPEGQVRLDRGRVFFGPRSVEGLAGTLRHERGTLEGRLGLEGRARPLVEARIHQDGPDLAGHLSLAFSSDTAPTQALARNLTEDLLEDLHLEASAEGRWQGGGLRWAGTLHQLSAQFNAFELHQARPSALHGDGTAAEVDISLDGGAREVENALSDQAASMRLSGTLPFSLRNPVALRIQGAANLSHLKTIFDRVMEVDEYNLLSELRVEGYSQFDLLAHGTYREPLLDGALTLDQGQVNLRGYQGVEDLRAGVLFKGRTLSIPEDKPMRGTLAHGNLRVSGDLAWRPGGLDTYALKADLFNFQLRDVPEGLDLQGTLRATLEGNESGGLLQGRLRADRLTYQTEVKLADLILRSALRDSGGLMGLDLDDPLDRIRLDLDLDLRSPWSFDTNLLKLEGRTEGPFQVAGTLAHPVPRGTMVFQPGGRITNIFPAGDMVVDRGSLAFSESRPLDPVINLQGSVSSIPGYTVNLDIRGTLSNLTIVPSSTPSLRQDEIVAILINPGNVANVGSAGASTATQGAITSGVASAGSGLISTLAFAPFQEQLRRTLGLDRVNVAVRTTSVGTTETEVTLGKSVSLLGQRSAFVVSHKRSGELSITSGQVEWRFGTFILQLGASKGGSAGLNPSGEIRHTWSPR